MVSVNVFHWTYPGYLESLGSNPATLMSQLLLVQIQIVVLLNPGTNPLDLTALTQNLVTPSHPGSTRWVRAEHSNPHSNPVSADSEPRTGGSRRTLKSKSHLRNLDCRYRNCRLKASKPDLDKPCMSNCVNCTNKPVWDTILPADGSAFKSLLWIEIQGFFYTLEDN